jgi:hypothetical protein
MEENKYLLTESTPLFKKMVPNFPQAGTSYFIAIILNSLKNTANG